MSRTKTDPAVLSARQNLRNNLKRASQKVHDQQTMRAYDEVRWRAAQASRSDVDKTYQAVVYGVSQLATAVVRSMGVTAPVHVITNSYTTAATDFRSIAIKVAWQKYDVKDFEQMRRLVSFVKGLVYHEAGHLLYTVPFLKLRDAASPELVEELGHSDSTVIHKSWNMLEDQRMETAMVRRSGILQHYFQTIVLDHVASSWEPGRAATNPWPLVAGRAYLPKDFLTAWKSEAVDACTAAGHPDLVDNIAKVIRRYKKADNANDMWRCIMEFADLMRLWSVAVGTSSVPSAGLDHLTFGERGSDKGKEEEVIKKSASSDDDESKDEDTSEGGPTSPAADSSEQQEEGDEDEATGGAQESDDEGDEAAQGASASDGDSAGEDRVPTDSQEQGEDAASSGKAPITKTDVREHIDNVLDELISDSEIKDFVSSVNEEMRASMHHNVSTRPMGTAQAAGEQVCRGMIGALEVLMDHTEPAWRFRQEHGVLDPVAFQIHEPGDTDYWINLDDEGKSGFDLAVSVMLDVSSSMAGSEEDLGVATYGIRRACDDLGIPCTVTTFSDDSQMLWDATEDVTPIIPMVQGSTQPLYSLRALDDQRHGKTRHLVVILTDGVWSGDIDLGRWRDNGRYIVVAGIGSEYLLDYLNKRNPDYAVSISGPLDLPREVTKALIPFIA